MDEEIIKKRSPSAKWDAMTEAANTLIVARENARDEKTLRLRNLRLAKEQADAKRFAR
jgi:hypothetical protein